MFIVDIFNFDNFPWFLEVAGIWSNPGRGKWMPLLRFLAYVCFFIEVVQIYSMSYGGFTKRTLQEEGFFTMIFLITTTHNLYFQWNQRLVNRIIGAVDQFEKDHKYDWEHNIFNERSKEAWKLVNAYFRFIIGFCTVYSYIPIIIDFIAGNIFESFPVIRGPIPLQGFVNAAGARTFQGLLWTILSQVWSFFQCLAHTGGEWSLYLAINYTKIEMEIISMKISIMKKKMSENRDLNYMKGLSNIANHHQKVVRILDDMIELFGFPVALQNTIISVCFCVNLFSMTTMENQDDFLPALQNTCTFVTIMGIVYFVCKTGQSLETQNNKMFSDLYDLPWYEQEPAFRKDLNMMIRQTRMPFVIHYHRKSPLLLETFMEIVNTSYSYFMVLKSAV